MNLIFEIIIKLLLVLILAGIAMFIHTALGIFGMYYSDQYKKFATTIFKDLIHEEKEYIRKVINGEKQKWFIQLRKLIGKILLKT